MPRLLEIASQYDVPELELKRISGGVLVQDPDRHELNASRAEKRRRSAPQRPDESRALQFAWKVCKHVKSNAIVFAREGETIGIGAGEMSRVDSVKIAVMKAQSPLKGTVIVSDAFFPFPDGVQKLGKPAPPPRFNWVARSATPK